MNKFHSLRQKASVLLLVALLLGTFGLSAQQITLNVKNATVRQAIEKLQKDYGYSFSIDAKGVDVNRIITVNTKNSDLNTVLELVFLGQNIDFTVKGNVITVFEKAKASTKSDKEKQRIVKGIVSDETNSPVIGATVMIEGTTTGATTGIDGSFALPVAKGNTISVSYIGYKTAYLNVDNNTTLLDIQLEVDATFVDEVVVIGYGTQRRELVTNAISQFKPNESNSVQALSPSELLQGRVAGMTVSTQSGNLGTAERVSIRGSASLNASNEPLYVIDGIPLNNESGSLYSYGEDLSSLSVLNLTGIESIEVLKDAASAAIYGSRATNGVILITTKQGREGKSETKINYNTGMNAFPNAGRIDYADSASWVDVYNTSITNYNKQLGYTPTSSGFVKQIQNPYEGLADTNWLDQISRIGIFQSVDLSFSGGQQIDHFLYRQQLPQRRGYHQT